MKKLAKKIINIPEVQLVGKAAVGATIIVGLLLNTPSCANTVRRMESLHHVCPDKSFSDRVKMSQNRVYRPFTSDSKDKTINYLFEKPGEIMGYCGAAVRQYFGWDKKDDNITIHMHGVDC